MIQATGAAVVALAADHATEEAVRHWLLRGPLVVVATLIQIAALFLLLRLVARGSPNQQDNRPLESGRRTSALLQSWWGR